MTPPRGFLLAWVLALAALNAHAELILEPCRLTAPRLPGVAAACGRLAVPEDRAAPDAPTIELFIARVPSLNAEPRPDPLVIIAGGPGQAATQFYLSSRAAFETIRRERDIIVLDQRGTGSSAPLACAEASATSLEQAATAELPGLMRTCLASLDADPRFYTTAVAVEDLDAVRDALELDRWNLYGISYGTRVAQHYLRHYPEHTRALILDGVVPSDAALGSDIAIHAQRSLDRVFARCADSAACAARFPRVAEQFKTLLRELDSTAATIVLRDPTSALPGAYELTGDGLRSAVRLLSYTPQTAALLPLLIDAASAGDFTPVAAQTRMLSADLEATLSLPMHNAVVCTEDVPFFPTQAPELLASTYLGMRVVAALRAVCSVWPAGQRDADLRLPLVSDRPVLILSGEADPITPPAYGERVIAGLENARHLVGAGQGHGLAVTGCVPRLMHEFLVSLAPEAIDASCLEREQASPFFLDFNGPSP